MAAAASVLACRDVGKTYGTTTVLDGVNLELEAGSVHALVGANGAGKSTLIGILAGTRTPDPGSRMTLGGAPFAPRGRAEAERAGVRWVAQELHLVDTLSVAENLYLARLPQRRGLIDRRVLAARARRALVRVGLASLDPATPVERLGVGTRQLLVIAAALDGECRVLLLDEPTAALAPPEVARLFENIREMQKRGVAVVYVSHFLGEIHRLADVVTVLRDGVVVGETFELGGWSLERATSEMLERMSGGQAGSAGARVLDRPRQAARPAPALLVVEGLKTTESAPPVDLVVHQGEIVGLFGMVGAGRTRLLRALYGAEPAASGTIRRGAHEPALRVRQPRDLVRAGMAMVPEDRKTQGLLLPLSVRANVSLPNLAEQARSGWLVRGREHAEASLAMTHYDVRCLSSEQPAQELSGGNQQKALLARWWLKKSEVLLLDKPTRGIDVASRLAIYGLLRELAAGGKAIVVASNEPEELISLCDRVFVMVDGALRGPFTGSDLEESVLLGAALDQLSRQEESESPR